ncbi:hypothetical protein [[Clostridium] fimetarium]|uniref:Uncharacterized protein n=1 Tax=[Clostridium] fimetarium TaxID=99656 RepID=A0A1I0QC75_9FIRM|nr:hypothetical protein [[Clostridium] fimetarium]SEW24478.1 hypothetical protein SAMN05421659_107171 [[Clostridium] fimetarium]
MSQVFKTYLTLFLIFLGVLILIGIITADIDISNSRDYKNYVIDQMENSNLSDSVIEACKTNAKIYHYELVTKSIKDDIGKTIAVEVILKYNYSIKLVNVLIEHELRGYAR